MNAISKEKTMIHRNDGFSLIEALVAVALTLVVLAAGFGIFRSVTHSGSAASHVYEITADTQAALNLIRRDLQKTSSIPETGIPLAAAGDGEKYWKGEECLGECSRELVKSDYYDYTIPDDSTILLVGTPTTDRSSIVSDYVFDAVTPTKVNGRDALIIIYEDDFANNISAGTTLSASGYTNFTLSSGVNNVLRNSIRDGDFISLRTGPDNPDSDGLPVLQRVTCGSSCGANITLDSSSDINNDTRVTDGNLNGNVSVSILRRVTYYLKEDGNNTVLMRQVNSRPAEKIVSGVRDFNLSYDIIELDASGLSFVTSPDATDPAKRSKDTAFFYETGANSGPRRVMDIRRVNVEITLDSDPVVVLGNNKVKRTQLTGMAVRRNYEPSPPPPDDPPPDDRPGDFSCTYGSGCTEITCKLVCTNGSGAGCEVYFLPNSPADLNPDVMSNYDFVSGLGSSNNNWFNSAGGGKNGGHEFLLKHNNGSCNGNNLWFGGCYSVNYVKPNGVFWMYFKYTTSGDKVTKGPIPMVWNPGSTSCSAHGGAPYAYCDMYNMPGCVERPIPQ